MKHLIYALNTLTATTCKSDSTVVCVRLRRLPVLFARRSLHFRWNCANANRSFPL